MILNCRAPACRPIGSWTTRLLRAIHDRVRYLRRPRPGFANGRSGIRPDRHAAVGGGRFDYAPADTAIGLSICAIPSSDACHRAATLSLLSQVVDNVEADCTIRALEVKRVAARRERFKHDVIAVIGGCPILARRNAKQVVVWQRHVEGD